MSTPLFDWLEHRAAGLLLHPTALPGSYGIGTLGQEARRFVRLAREAGFSYWQMCPLGPTGFGDSPYQCFSAFAGNPYLIDPRPLVKAGLLRDDALGPLVFLPSDRVDFGGLYHAKRPILRQAFEVFAADRRRGRHLPYGDFQAFKETHAAWLEPYSLFRALKDHYDGRPWFEWPTACLTHAAAVENGWRTKMAAEAEAHQFYQYLFFGQWKQLRSHAASEGLRIIGDIPLFVALDSADVWSHPDLFQLDRRSGHPLAVAGCPPDYFAENGQLWGNPLFDWEAMKASGYDWWIERLRMNFELYDVVRLDHFRGFESYWSIPYGAPTAKSGRWAPGPGRAFFETIREVFPQARLVAEDLGILTPEVIALRDETGLPGMAVLQFAFGGEADNFYLPHNLQPNSVLYPGTHDNDTSLGWYQAAPPAVRDHVRRYLRVSGSEIGWDFIRAAYGAVSRLTVIPMQDILSLDSSGRFNTPGEAQGNWQWRMSEADLNRLTGPTITYLKELGNLYGRLDPAD